MKKFTFILLFIMMTITINKAHASEVNQINFTDTSIRIGPIPATTYFQIYTIGIDLSESMIQITDGKGKMFFQQFGTGYVSLAMFQPKLSTGIYFVTIWSGFAWDTRRTFKILISK